MQGHSDGTAECHGKPAKRNSRRRSATLQLKNRGRYYKISNERGSACTRRGDRRPHYKNASVKPDISWMIPRPRVRRCCSPFAVNQAPARYRVSGELSRRNSSGRSKILRVDHDSPLRVEKLRQSKLTSPEKRRRDDAAAPNQRGVLRFRRRESLLARSRINVKGKRENNLSVEGKCKRVFRNPLSPRSGVSTGTMSVIGPAYRR